METSSTITVTFLDVALVLDPGDSLSFGRNANLQIDTFDGMPDIVGSLQWEPRGWWLRSESRSVDLRVDDRSSGSFQLVSPGSSMILTFSKASIRFRVGSACYELEFSLAVPPRAPTSKSHYARARLNREQRQLLVALAERRLMDPNCHELPQNRDVAERLGWRLTKFNRKLDHLCVKFDKKGVAGLRGSPKQLATDRRQRLVEYCIESGVIGVSDLKVLGDDR